MHAYFVISLKGQYILQWWKKVTWRQTLARGRTHKDNCPKKPTWLAGEWDQEVLLAVIGKGFIL